MIGKVVSIIIFFTVLIPGSLMSETLNIGGEKVEIVNGEIGNNTAKNLLSYLTKRYERNADVTKEIGKINRYYKGPLEPDFLFLLGKSQFMQQKHWKSFDTFLKLYEGHPRSKIVKSGSLKNIVDKAVSMFLKPEYNLTSYRRFRILDTALKFGALYKYIAGKPHNALNKLIESGYKREKSYNIETISNIKKTGSLYKLSEYSYAISNTSVIEGSFHAYVVKMMFSNFISPEATYFSVPDRKPGLTFVKSNWDKSKSGTSIELKIPGLRLIDYFAFSNRIGSNGADFFIDNKELKLNNRFDVRDFFQELEQKTNTQKEKMSINIHLNTPKKKKQYTINCLWDIRNLSVGSIRTRNGVHVTQLNLGTITFRMDTLKDLIIAKHGSVYGWVGLEKKKDLL